MKEYLASIDLPVRPLFLTPGEVNDLGKALQQIGRQIELGGHRQTGTFIVPYQERFVMKVSFDVKKQGGGKYFNFDLEYHDLPEPYVWDIASKATAFSKAVENTKSKGAGQKTYTVTFKWGGDKQRGEAKADNLSYSEMVGLQDAGIELLKQLMQSAHLEIASGQRT